MAAGSASKAPVKTECRTPDLQRAGSSNSVNGPWPSSVDPMAPVMAVDSRLRVPMINISLKWTLENFRFLRGKSDELYSSPVSFPSLGFPGIEAYWCMKAVPNFMPKDNDPDKDKGPFLSIYVSLMKIHDKLKIPADFEIAVLNRAGTAQHMVIARQPKPDIFCKDGFPAWGRAKAVPHSVLFADNSEYLVDGNLVLRADISFCVDPKEELISQQSVIPPTLELLQKYSKRFADVQRSKAGTDFVLISSDKKELPVHRVVLMTHSPVFAAMLTQDTQEKQTGRCTITDTDAATLEILLEFMYACSISRIAELPDKLLRAADKYQVSDLRLQCEKSLSQHLTVHNVVDRLILADTRGLKSLEQAATAFIAKNLTAVVDTNGIQRLKEHKVALMKKVLRSFSESFEST